MGPHHRSTYFSDISILHLMGLLTTTNTPVDSKEEENEEAKTLYSIVSQTSELTCQTIGSKL